MKSEESLGSEGSRGGGGGGGCGDRFVRESVHCIFKLGLLSYGLKYASVGVACCQMCVCVCVCAGRMGNPRAALELIIKKLQDVDMVTECSASCL